MQAVGFPGTPLPSNLASSPASPEWLNKADNSWQMTSAAMVGLQSVPGLIILYGSMVKKKWAVNSAFMALYAFAAVLVCWVLWGYQMSFGHGRVWGIPKVSVQQDFLLSKMSGCNIPTVSYVFFQFVFAAITVILLAGSLLGRMNFYAWMLFVPLWLTFSYTVGAFCIWDRKGFLHHMGIVDFSGGYVIHLSSGVAGFTAAYWVGARLTHDRQAFPPNNIIHMLGGAGLLWLGWSGFNGGAPCSANLTASLAVLNTHVCTATSILIWISLDMIVYRKSSVIGAVQGMITGLVCITPGAGVVETWAAVLMGVMAGSLPWYTMMILHRRSALLQKVDDTLAVFHTHAVAGLLGGMLSGVFADHTLMRYFYGDGINNRQGLVYSFNANFQHGAHQMGIQALGAAFITAWNIFITSLICLAIRKIIPLRMNEWDLKRGDDAVHGEEAYALWGDGEKTHVLLYRSGLRPTTPAPGPARALV